MAGAVTNASMWKPNVSMWKPAALTLGTTAAITTYTLYATSQRCADLRTQNAKLRIELMDAYTSVGVWRDAYDRCLDTLCREDDAQMSGKRRGTPP